MTIDEAIEHAREAAFIERRKCVEEQEQLAKWLEELKVRRMMHTQAEKEFFKGYNKALDDFIKMYYEYEYEEKLKGHEITIEEVKELLVKK